jgi:hypothetical protein
VDLAKDPNTAGPLARSTTPKSNLFTAQPEAPAFVLAGASGWAVNDYANDPLAMFRYR